MPPVFSVVNSTDVVSVWHIIWSWGSFTCAVGFTVIVNVSVGPSQLTPALVYVGVTTIVAVTGEVPLLTAVKEAMSPLPVAAKPILGVSFSHEYVVVPEELVWSLSLTNLTRWALFLSISKVWPWILRLGAT